MSKNQSTAAEYSYQCAQCHDPLGASDVIVCPSCAEILCAECGDNEGYGYHCPFCGEVFEDTQTDFEVAETEPIVCGTIGELIDALSKFSRDVPLGNFQGDEWSVFRSHYVAYPHRRWLTIED